MITVETNKDLFVFAGIDGVNEISDRKFDKTDTIIPAGTEFNVLDIMIDRNNDNLGKSHTAFLCENEELEIMDWIILEDIEDKYWQMKSRF